MDAFGIDPRVEGLLFMSSWKPLLSILVCYAAIVYYGPQWMAKRKAFNMRYVVLIYDLTVAFLHLNIFFKYNWVCEPVHYNAVSDDEMAIVTNCHLFFICKLVELMDTVFYVLRKKDKLIALHYYHHLGMVFFTYIGVRWTPGGSLFFIPLMNSFVHFTVYFDHSLTLVQSNLNQWWWWRRYMFISMALQVILGLFHSLSAIIVGCETGRYFNYALFIAIVTYVVLHVMHIIRTGFQLKITDIMRYSSKVNKD